MRTIIIIGIVLVVFIGVIGAFYLFIDNKSPIACTEEAKLCPDGSYVARNSELNCEFNPCPEEDDLVGGDKDENRCIGSAGYTWDEDKQKCIRVWEERLKQECVNLGCEGEMLFAGSKNSDKYYECDCHYALRINPENLICFKSDEDAVADGRVKSDC